MHVITGLGAGGAEGQLALLARRQHAAGRAVTVVSLLAGGARRGELGAVPVVDLGMRRGRLSASALSRLSLLIRERRPDVVQGWLYHGDLMALAGVFLSGRWRSTRLYWGLRCSDMDGARYRRLVRTCAWASRLPAGVVANSEAGLRAHLACGYRPRARHVIANGIDTERFRPDACARTAVRAELGIAGDVPVVAHVARVDPMKDHATMLEALERTAGVSVLAVGAGTETLAHHPRLYRLGERADVARLFAASDVVLSSSAFGEGFPNVLAEGMACGLAAVATDVGDSRLVVGGCGCIVGPGDARALGDAMRGALAMAGGCDPRGRIRRHFSVARMVAAYDALYDASDVAGV